MNQRSFFDLHIVSGPASPELLGSLSLGFQVLGTDGVLVVELL